MLQGAASANGTGEYIRRHSKVACGTLGRNRWCISSAGFGGYRVSAEVDDHVDALMHALCRGINLIDTSTNYTDGASERLVGQVLERLAHEKQLYRQQVVIVSKIGYLQGQNLAFSRQREQEGRPFADVVPYGRHLKHCIHPGFIEDQLTRSLERLRLETLDVLLLHNPEYYLKWAVREGADIRTARQTFYERIRRAFIHLEDEVARGRIQAYGISANSFVSSVDAIDLVDVERIWQIARQIRPDHHFGVIQFPLNLFESNAVLEPNQDGGRSVLSVAHAHRLGVLVNRPLNAFYGDRLVRLAEPERMRPRSDDDVIQAIRSLNKSETTLWRKLLPDLSLPSPLYRRIKEQVCVADQLKHYWRNFGSWERWCQVRDGYLKPYVQGVMDYLNRLPEPSQPIVRWLQEHPKRLEAAFRAVGSLYVSVAVKAAERIGREVAAADSDWGQADALSRKALRAIRSTSGISSVLVGMRRKAYVDDVIDELKRPVPIVDRTSSWRRLKEGLQR
jgi:aryl-alcohol dehydrogenase-like predicted oxidoreductase